LGILYAPDHVINAGGSLHGVGLVALGWTRDQVERRFTGIGGTLTAISREADEQRIPTSEGGGTPRGGEAAEADGERGEG
jgi:glutamate dehydrogenase/leucine dehydrogenase